MKLDLSFEQNQQNINVPFSESGGQFSANFGETSVLHDGQNGATFYPTVSTDGIISWENDRGLQNPLPVNIKGKDGQDGKDGINGYTPVKGIDYFDGKDGKDGYTPIKNKDYFDGKDGKDGYTPVKNVDYFDGKNGQNGKDGQDGYTPIKGKDYFDGKDGVNGKDGYTPIKGKDYFDGVDGKNGIDGKDGFSPVVAVDDIENGHRVTITDKDGTKTFDVMDGKDGTGGGGDAIIDVIALPETDINKDAFYRLLTGKFYYNGTPQGAWTCYVVETLPTIGEPVTMDMVHVLLYYAVDTEAVSGYVDSTLGGAVGVPAGWYPVEALAQAFNLPWGGIAWSESDIPTNAINILLLSYSLYQYKRDWDNISGRIGWEGTGNAGSEVFNSLKNTASGVSSHAEGYETTASGDHSHAEGGSSHAEGGSSHAEGDRSHAEGYASHAEGDRSHAEGGSSHAEGYASHAEGDRSHAEGGSSHAEGGSSHAEGDRSHAEGYASHAEGAVSRAIGFASHAEGNVTIAAGRSQHTQGEYNVVDPEYDVNDGSKRGKYAHIVGNGTSDIVPSNAHTLDWNGLGWFAGGLKVGGEGQDDPEAEAILTESQVKALINDAIGVIENGSY